VRRVPSLVHFRVKARVAGAGSLGMWRSGYWGALAVALEQLVSGRPLLIGQRSGAWPQSVLAWLCGGRANLFHTHIASPWPFGAWLRTGRLQPGSFASGRAWRVS